MYNMTNGTVTLVDIVYGEVNVNNTVVNRTLVGQRAFLQVFDPTYFKVVYTSRNFTTDVFTQINVRHVHFFNGTKTVKNDTNVAQLNAT